jgi:predicted RecB family nuclease
MGTLYGGETDLLEKLQSHAFNILSAIYGYIYFPVYSNDLKSIASFLGFKWSNDNASGLRSLLGDNNGVETLMKSGSRK